jgi:hypothetical protein
MGLIEKLIAWARSAWNWLKNFFKKWWGRIVSWWSKLRIWFKECIQRYKEIVLLDAREDGGRALIEAIQEAQPETVTIDDIDNGPVAVSINYDNTIAKIDSHDADVMQEDQYESMQAKHNGILRITG